jgi:hypothetical protein
VPRPPLGPGDRTIHLVDAAQRLGLTRSTLQSRVRAKDPSIRGLAPPTGLNPGRNWLVSLDDVEAELRGKGLLDPIPTDPGPSLDAMRAQMLQGALNDEKDRRIAQLEAEKEEIRALLEAENERLRAQLAALGQMAQEQLAVSSRWVAAVSGAPAG